MRSGHHVLYELGYTHVTMGVTIRNEGVTRSKSVKSSLSSDYRLQLACMKLESLVIVNQHVTVNTFSGLVHTARQAMKILFT